MTRSARGYPSSTRAGAAERPRREGGGREDGGEREQRHLDAVATEPEPEGDPEHRGSHTGARRSQEYRDGRRVGKHRPARNGSPRPGRRRQLQRQHEQDVGGERECVPVADRIAQPCRPATVGEERRDRLAGQRPDDRGPERRDEGCGRPAACARAAGAEQEPDGQERREHERPVELLPGAVGRHRPRNGEPGPGRRREEHAEQRRPAAGLRCTSGEREGTPAACDEQGRERRPDRVACEERGQQQRGRDRHRHSGPPHRAPSYHAPRKASPAVSR